MDLTFLILLSLALGVGAWLFFVWSVKSGQYDDPEGPKYRMLDDEDGPGPRDPDDTPRKRGPPAQGGRRSS